jgi:hypothetical protein
MNEFIIEGEEDLAEDGRCHCCGSLTEGECPFDVEMNPHRTPRPCCGSCRQSCAECV